MNIDVTALKRFTLNDRFRMEFAGQIYNLVNHAQYVPGYTNDIQPTSHSADASVCVVAADQLPARRGRQRGE